METPNGHPLAVCSWSLDTEIRKVMSTLDALNITHVHLSVGSVLAKGGEQYLRLVRNHDWTITATMVDFPQEDYSTLESIRRTGGIMPDDYWDFNRQRFLDAAEVSAQLATNYLTTHAGFLQPDNPEKRTKFTRRIEVLADICEQRDLILLLETGQETARELRAFLEEFGHPAVGVNFDPANMVLYNSGDPVEALHVLSPWIHHIHIKDAQYTDTPGTWGVEVPWGEGDVDSRSFLTALEEIGYQGALAIERESGTDCVGDIKLAIQRLTG